MLAPLKRIHRAARTSPKIGRHASSSYSPLLDHNSYINIEIRRQPPFAAARVIGAVFGVAGLFAILAGWLLTALFDGVVALSRMPMAVAALVIPFIWWLLAYASSAAFCFFYNLLAGHFGGMVLETSDIPGERHDASRHQMSRAEVHG